MRKEGTVISGTLRSMDLRDAFVEELQSIQMDKDHGLDLPEHRELRDVVEDTILDLMCLGTVYDESDELEAALDILNIFAPVGMYFGAHEGDGADFGWWKDPPTQEDGAMSMTEADWRSDWRREFEEWIKAEPYNRDVRRHPDDPRRTQWAGHYRDYTTQLTWEAWRTARGLGQEDES